METEQRNIFQSKVCDQLVKRINVLIGESNPLWGSMNVCEIMAHCSLGVEFYNSQREASVNPIIKLFLKPMMCSVIIGPKAYKRNAPTTPYFKAIDVQDFELEKQRLINNVFQYSAGGKEKAERINHTWLDKLKSTECSWAMYKHLYHNLKQFGV